MHSLFDLFLFRHFKLSTHCYLLSTQTHRQMLRPQHQKLISTFMLNNPFLSPASLLSSISLNLPAKQDLKSTVVRQQV